jgi:prepilin-type N-terminal cleavage/methylation domain-containing protein
MNGWQRIIPMYSSCTDLSDRKKEWVSRGDDSASAAGRSTALRVERNGFTLLEILVAIVMLSMVLTTVYAAFTGTLSLVDRTQYGDRIYGMARTALTRMTEDMGGLCTCGGSRLFTATEAENDFMNLAFSSSAHFSFDDEAPPGAAFITYTPVEEPGETGAILYRKAGACYGDNDDGTEEAAGHILCRSLQSVTYSLYKDGGEASETWDADSEDGNNAVPAVVSISLKFVNPDYREHPYSFMTSVYIPPAEKKDETDLK